MVVEFQKKGSSFESHEKMFDAIIELYVQHIPCVDIVDMLNVKLDDVYKAIKIRGVEVSKDDDKCLWRVQKREPKACKADVPGYIDKTAYLI